jgi:hypothetical protein
LAIGQGSFPHSSAGHYAPDTLSKGLPRLVHLPRLEADPKCHGNARFVAHFCRTRRLDFGHPPQGKETGFHNEKEFCQNGQEDHQNHSKD